MSQRLTAPQLRLGRPLGSLRAQSLPLPSPRVSFPPDVEDTEMYLFQSPRHSISSVTSRATSIGSSATADTYSTAQSSPVSLVSSSSPPSSRLQSRFKTSRRPVFQGLPPEIYDCILQQLRIYHEDSASQSCQTCYLRDMCSLALTNRAWDKAVVKRMWVATFRLCTIQEHATNVKQLFSDTSCRTRLKGTDEKIQDEDWGAAEIAEAYTAGTKFPCAACTRAQGPSPST